MLLSLSSSILALVTFVVGPALAAAELASLVEEAVYFEEALCYLMALNHHRINQQNYAHSFSPLDWDLSHLFPLSLSASAL